MSEQSLAAGAPEPQEKITDVSSLENSVSIVYEPNIADYLTAIEVIDAKNRIGTTRTFHLLGVGLVLWMFVPQLYSDPGQIISWLMVALAAGLAVVVWKAPAANNLRFAKSKVEGQSQVRATIDLQKIEMQSAEGKSEYRYDDAMSVFNYKNVLAINVGRTRVGMIPKDQLEEPVRETVIRLLRQGLGDRFETVEGAVRRRL